VKRTKIRQLKPSEPRPEGEPKRYTSDKRGYVRLRWKVGPAEYVEVYEHRLIAGVPDADVHHENEDKSDNDPSNLHQLSHADHARLHMTGAPARGRVQTARRWTQWDGMRGQAAYDKLQRRLAREAERKEFLQRIAAMYRGGMTVIEIAAETGKDNSTISRRLRQAGVRPRTPGGGKSRNEIPPASRQIVCVRAGMRCEKCGRGSTWDGQCHHRQRRALRDHSPSNLLFLCPACHRKVHAGPEEARDGGWIISQYNTDPPEEIPVRHWNLGLVYLTPDGGVVTEAERNAREDTGHG
jgi:HNH endonuclease